MRSSGVLPGVIAVASATVLAVLHGCQETPEPTEPELAATVVRKTLTVKGSGSRSGVVTSQAGLTPAINCAVGGSHPGHPDPAVLGHPFVQPKPAHLS
jgi:hypothetical protein